MLRSCFLSLVTYSVLIAVAANAQADNALVTDKLGKKIENVAFTDLNGKPAPLSAIKDKKAVVVVFMSFECPVSNSYAVTLMELNKQFGDKGVAFVAVSTSGDAAEAKKQADEFKIPFPVYLDPKLDATDAFKATTTPEAFVLDHNSVLRYRGRIDNAWSARLKKSPQTTEFDLKNAIEDILAGKDVKVPATKPIGCPVAVKGAIAKAATTTLTYHKDVQPILQEHCQECHRPNAVGPFSLTNYKQATAWEDDIKAYTQDKKMPPWKPSAGAAFHNERKLTDEQIKTLAAWVDGGVPEGDPKDAPKPKEFTDGWQLGKPDLILTVQDDFIVGPSGRDTFRCFVLPTNLNEDKYVIGFEVKPANQRVVHHTLNFWDTTGQGRKMEEAAKEKAKPSDQDRGPGYSSAMGVGFRGAAGTFGGMGGWAPGQMPRFLPKGTGYFLPKGADLVIQTHYHRDGKEEKDRLQIGLYFAKEKIEKPYQVLVVSGFGPLQWIPAGKSDYKTTGTAIVNADCTIHSVMPHMHLLGKTVKVTMTPPNGTAQTLVQIGDWDYNWQETYWFKEPLQVKAGTQLEIEAVFDNSDKNPNNPKSPPGTVFIGEQTTNEMLFGFLGATTDVKGQRLSARSTNSGKRADDKPKDPPKQDTRYEIPYKLTDTKHVMVRVKLNGKGPFNFILDTGAPALIMSDAVAKKAGIKMENGWGKFKLDIEGGATLPEAKGIALDMFQLKGMNSLGVAGVELHGVLGYGILARFRIQYDFTEDKLVWTPLEFDPPEIKRIGKSDGSQGGLEVLGNMMKFLAPLMGLKPNFQVKPRGFLGLELETRKDGIFVKSVIKDGPADKAGVKPGDLLEHAKSNSVESVEDVLQAVSKLSEGDKLFLRIKRDGEKKDLTIELGKGL